MNTKYFHGVTTIRRRRNFIATLQDTNGVWITDPHELERTASNYFQELFSRSDKVSLYALVENFPVLEAQVITNLEKNISDEEIY